MKQKVTPRFKNVIQDKLAEIAEQDPLFKASFEKPHKNIDECINYILTTVQKSGINGFTDDEVYAMAIHYYDEDNIKDIKEINLQVVVNHRVELTEEEKKEQKEKALKEVYQEQRNKVTAKPQTKQKSVVAQPTLF